MHTVATPRTALGIALAALCMLLIGSAGAGADDESRRTKVSRAESLAAWEQIAGVLLHPRCLNCHQKDAPLQGDARRVHVPLVVRGPDNHGAAGMRCNGCHNEIGNNDWTRTPGAPHWSLAPVSMLWQGLSSAQICRSLKDPKLNGNRDADALLKHMGEDALVLWGWKPGAGREPVPMPHARFFEQLEVWIAGGMSCPGG